MEYCSDSDLNTFIKNYKNKNNFIDEKIVYNIISDICQGIKVIHDNNIISSYLKPENILITEDNTIKINGFQLSTKYNDNEFASNTISTIYYMAPEIIKGEKYNNRYILSL